MNDLIQFGISQGMAGWYALIFDNDGPIQSGIGYYETKEEAAKEAIEWAECENYPMEAEKLRKHYNL